MSNQKPNWAPDAIATTAGWVNPKTNELLVSVRGLAGALPYIKGRIIHPVAQKVAAVVEAAAKVAEDVQEAVATAVAEVEEEVQAAPIEDAPQEAKPVDKKAGSKKSKRK